MHEHEQAPVEPAVERTAPPVGARSYGPDAVIAWQRTIGNRAVRRLLTRQRHSRRPHSGGGAWPAGNPIGTRPPRRAPMAAELAANPVVIAAMHQAWLDTHADEPGRPRAVEQGGWIYIDLTDGHISVRPATPPSLHDRYGTYHINLSNPPGLPGSALVANFHTHPSGSDHDDDDAGLAARDAIPGFVVRGDLVLDTYGLPVRGGNWARAAAEPRFPQ